MNREQTRCNFNEINSIKSASTNPRYDTIDNQNIQPSGSKGNWSMAVHESNILDSNLEEDDHPLRASNMNELSNPAKPFCQNESTLDETMISN